MSKTNGNSKPSFYIDFGRAERVFDALIKRLRQKGPPYNYAHVPQAAHLLPKTLEQGSREHATFLFQLCLWMRGGVESDTATDLLGRLYDERPRLFEPKSFVGNWDENVENITRSLNEYQLGQRVSENGPGWCYNMGKLGAHWDADPRKLMSDKPEFDVLARRIIGKTANKGGSLINHDSPHGFRFFQHKMTAMIAYFLMDAGLVDIFYTPVPVDFHVLRLLTTNLIIRVSDKEPEETLGINFYNAPVLKLAREVTEWYCRTSRVSPVALCDALWLLSRTLCRDNPGNSAYVLDGREKKTNGTKVSKDELFAIEEVGAAEEESKPVVRGRRRFRGYKWSSEEVWKTPERIARYERSCGVCPLNGTCTFNISAGKYYAGGELVPERLRERPPENQQQNLLDLPLHELVRRDPTVRYAKIEVD